MDLRRYAQNLSSRLEARGVAVPGSAACARPVTWRGAVLGGVLPAVAVATTGSDPEACAAQARAARQAGADLVELRADLLAAPVADTAGNEPEPGAPEELAALWLRGAAAVAQALRGSDMPVLLTVRTASEGGGLDADDAVYRDALARVIERLGRERHAAADCRDAAAGEDGAGGASAAAVVAAVDVELARGGLPRIVQLARGAGLDVVASSHDFTATPGEAELLQRLHAMQGAGAAVAKVAVTPRATADVERALGVAARAREELEIPVVVIAMGAGGAVTRLAGGVFGSALTFATAGSAASAPGQLPVAQVRAALAALHP
ncbi:type I 3-dehydroquinate dehydratase [Actinomyces sp. 432]|uniref:type I 3-dehydroquinate dehydratase n=1 Tax=Actinomyces sp. 432 TaxID=2057798 RepID=UPI00137B431B|nr:type I 3-dehydroquinate dehydratase [Actinomyces sp. 432]